MSTARLKELSIEQLSIRDKANVSYQATIRAEEGSVRQVEDDSLVSVGLGLGINLPKHLVKKNRLRSAVPTAHHGKLQLA